MDLTFCAAKAAMGAPTDRARTACPPYVVEGTFFGLRGGVFSELWAGPLRVSLGPDFGPCLARGPSQKTECGSGAYGSEMEGQSGTS